MLDSFHSLATVCAGQRNVFALVGHAMFLKVEPTVRFSLYVSETFFLAFSMNVCFYRRSSTGL